MCIAVCRCYYKNPYWRPSASVSPELQNQNIISQVSPLVGHRMVELPRVTGFCYLVTHSFKPNVSTTTFSFFVRPSK